MNGAAAFNTFFSELQVYRQWGACQRSISGPDNRYAFIPRIYCERKYLPQRRTLYFFCFS